MSYPFNSQDRLAIYYSNLAYDIHTFRVGECECLVVENDGCFWVAFRGTEGSSLIKERGFWDCIRDIRIWPWPSRRLRGRSHAGFYKGARGLVDRGLFGYLRRGVPIYLTGHSLGGALALNAGALLHYHGFQVEEVITFGSPRTFKKGLAEKVKGWFTVRQFAHNNDPVTEAPLDWFGYSHVNELVVGGGKKNLLSPLFWHDRDRYKETVHGRPYTQY